MDNYDKTARASARLLTVSFSDSFSLASRLFPPLLRQNIYCIYGLVRLADELADTYTGPNALAQLNALESETEAVLARGFSTNLTVHAFGLVARQAGIDGSLTRPFFASMRTDIRQNYTPDRYAEYIHGSAEVVGLMCLRVFCGQGTVPYNQLAPGARALSSALQKVNFLRDMAEDHQRLGRYYFPQGSFQDFDEESKQIIIADIRSDFAASLPAINQLSKDVRPAVLTAYRYFSELLEKIAALPAEKLKRERVRLPRQRKLLILSRTVVRERLRG